MPVLNYDPRSKEVHRDPYPFYKQLRDNAPVFHIQDPDKDFFVLWVVLVVIQFVAVLVVVLVALLCNMHSRLQ